MSSAALELACEGTEDVASPLEAVAEGICALEEVGGLWGLWALAFLFSATLLSAWYDWMIPAERLSPITHCPRRTSYACV